MTDERTATTTTDGVQPTHTHTTVVEKRGGGGGILIGLALLIGVIVVAYFLMNRADNENAQTSAITEAAQSVSDGAEKVGDAAKKAVE